MNKQNRNSIIDTENVFHSCHMGGASGGWVKKMKGLKNTNWLLQNSHGDVIYSIGNIVNTLITTVSDGCEIYWDDHLVSYVTSNPWGVHL